MDLQEEFLKKLRQTLLESTTFPTNYIYKFIVPNEESKILHLMGLFNFQGAIVTTKNSKTNKYKSFTISVLSNSAEEIIQKYREVSVISGIISL
jgi:putative lipoic acid-binding regulatory protein